MTTTPTTIAAPGKFGIVNADVVEIVAVTFATRKGEPVTEATVRAAGGTFHRVPTTAFTCTWTAE